MAEIVEPNVKNEEGTSEVGDTIAAALAPSVPEPTPPADDTVSDDAGLDDKYKGKTAAELAKMHKALESKLGEQGREVGELRRAFDQMIQSNIQATNAQSAAPEANELDDIDFLTDPKTSVAKAVAADPNVRQAQNFMAQMGRQQVVEAIRAKHPDMQEIVTTDEFRKWATGHPKRQELYNQAHEGYDFEAADLLMTDWKAMKKVSQAAAKVEEKNNQSAVAHASTGSSRGNNSASKAAPQTIRRTDIIELMKKDPKRYQAMQPEIMKAYSEGRVTK